MPPASRIAASRPGERLNRRTSTPRSPRSAASAQPTLPAPITATGDEALIAARPADRAGPSIIVIIGPFRYDVPIGESCLYWIE